MPSHFITRNVSIPPFESAASEMLFASSVLPTLRRYEIVMGQGRVRALNNGRKDQIHGVAYNVRTDCPSALDQR
jgi:hypothetical protein